MGARIRVSQCLAYKRCRAHLLHTPTKHFVPRLIVPCRPFARRITSINHVFASERMLMSTASTLASLSASESSRSIFSDCRNSSICATVMPCSCSKAISVSIPFVHALLLLASLRRSLHWVALAVKASTTSVSLLEFITCRVEIDHDVAIRLQIFTTRTKK